MITCLEQCRPGLVQRCVQPLDFRLDTSVIHLGQMQLQVDNLLLLSHESNDFTQLLHLRVCVGLAGVKCQRLGRSRRSLTDLCGLAIDVFELAMQ